VPTAGSRSARNAARGAGGAHGTALEIAGTAALP